MTNRKDLMKVYLDTNVILPWFENIMSGKNETPNVILFLVDHPEIEKYISSFTIAELVEHLMFKTDRIKGFMRKLDIITSFVEAFQNTIPNLSIIELEESKNGDFGILVPIPELIEYTSVIGSVSDSIQVCIAKHEDIYIVTKDDDIGKVQSLYPKTVGMIGFAKAFQ